jgi:hypothetical protein
VTEPILPVSPVEVRRVRVPVAKAMGAIDVAAIGDMMNVEMVDLVVMLTEAGYELWAVPPHDDDEDDDVEAGYGWDYDEDEVLAVEKDVVNENGEWCVRSKDTGRSFGCYPTRDEAEARLRQIESFARAETDTHTPPAAVRAEARRALNWIEDGEAGSGFTDVGRQRAGDLAAGNAISVATMRRMRSYFARHEVDKQGEGWSPGEPGYPSPGRVAWAAWGGDPGKGWVNRILRSEDAARKSIDESDWVFNARQKYLYDELEDIAETFGKFDAGTGADGAHYMTADDNPFAGNGMACSNCAFYAGPRACEIVTGDIDPGGLCKFWIIPEALLRRDVAAVKAEGLREGQFVSWNSSGGRARGQIEHVMQEGTLGIPDSSFSVQATPDDPAVLIRVWRRNADGWAATETLVGHKSSTVQRIESLAKDAVWVMKAEHERRFTLGPWYVPDRMDAHGEWTDADELQQALWEWLTDGDRSIKLQHDPTVTAGRVVEAVTWPAAVSYSLQNGVEKQDYDFPPNTVFLGVVWEPWAWELVKAGKIRGYSMAGRADRLMVDLPA